MTKAKEPNFYFVLMAKDVNLHWMQSIFDGTFENETEIIKKAAVVSESGVTTFSVISRKPIHPPSISYFKSLFGSNTIVARSNCNSEVPHKHPGLIIVGENEPSFVYVAALDYAGNYTLDFFNKKSDQLQRSLMSFIHFGSVLTYFDPKIVHLDKKSGYLLVESKSSLKHLDSGLDNLSVVYDFHITATFSNE